MQEKKWETPTKPLKVLICKRRQTQAKVKWCDKLNGKSNKKTTPVYRQNVLANAKWQVKHTGKSKIIHK